MSHMLIQLVLILTLLAALLMTWRRLRQDVISRGEAVLWSVLWIGAGFIILQPQTTTLVANFFGVGRGVDFVMYGAVVLLFVLVFKLFVALEVIERKLTDMVRKDALKDIPGDSPPSRGR